MGCRHIQLLAIGPDIQSGLVSDVPRTIPDIAPTIGELLGFTTEDATGTAMLELLDQTTETVRDDRGVLPASLALNNVYPTPFNSQLNIEYELIDPQQASINIFNLGGERVWTREVSVQGTGVHRLKWDGNDQAQNVLSSGIYIVQLSNQNHFLSQKVLLLK
jgi:hypothetical protein